MILVDTHVLVWHIQGEGRLGERARDHIEQARRAEGALVSAISAWEIGQLAKADRIRLSLDPQVWIAFVLALPGYVSASIDPALAVRAAVLDWQHRDPADRFLVATAQARGAPLLTADCVILAYAAQGHVQAIDARV